MSQCALLCVCALDGIVPAAYRVVRIFSFAQFILIPNAIRKYVNNKKEKNVVVYGKYNTIWCVVYILCFEWG